MESLSGSSFKGPSRHLPGVPEEKTGKSSVRVRGRWDHF